MKCFAFVALTLSLGLSTVTTHAQEYKPCFDEPVFQEATYDDAEFVQPEFEPGKRVLSQVEKPVFEATVRDIPLFERPQLEKPEFVKMEFDNGCTKKVENKSTPQKINWVSSYQPKKLILAQPLKKPSSTANSRLVAANRSR